MENNRIIQILNLFDEYYKSETICYLNYEKQKPWQLLIATILSAQCTDDRVNIVTKTLFKKYKTLEQFAGANLFEMENDIRSIGFFRMKAKNIISTAHLILEKYNGEMPHEIEKLTILPGVGRKTANVVRSHIFKIPSIVVDTHVKRITNKLEISLIEDPVKLEFDLMKKLPQEHWIRYNTQLIAHGRKVCNARKPKCNECIFITYCKDHK